jgi:4-diphosphocytidyl-2-C-methyl-D-erythritol kinase
MRPVAVSTPTAFKAWDDHIGCGAEDRHERHRKPAEPSNSKLTQAQCSDRITMFSRSVHRWLSVHLSQPWNGAGGPKTGVPRGDDRGDRAEALLLDLVRAGIENDFERVVFPEYPELREVKRALERYGAGYASLSGSGSTVYGLFASRDQAAKAAEALQHDGTPAEVTTTLTRAEYWDGILSS